MPLSEHEQRLLDQIERQLYAEDPKFASAVRAHDLKSHLSRRIKRYSALVVLGLAGLLGGVALHNVFVGVAGFLVMLVGVLVILRSLQRLGRGDSPVTPKPPKRADKRSFRERAEDRFRRRFEDDDS